MIRALENNALGVALASICGGLLVILFGIVVMWAMSPSTEPGAADEAEADITSDITVLQSARALEEYAVIGERPVFNEDRRPAPILAEDLGPEEGLPVDDVEAPDVELAGIVITPTLRMATLRSKERELSLVAFEGKPLEGDFGTWQVSRIDERMVTLASADGEEMQLELQVHDAVIKEPPKSERGDSEPRAEPGAEAAEAQPEGVSDPSETISRAEQIRQRIEERREELRRAAEDRDSDQAQNYRDAIQSMINQRNQERTQQQQDQDGGP